MAVSVTLHDGLKLVMCSSVYERSSPASFCVRFYPKLVSATKWTCPIGNSNSHLNPSEFCP